MRHPDPWEDTSLGERTDYANPQISPKSFAREPGSDGLPEPEPPETPRGRTTEVNAKEWDDDRQALHRYLVDVMSDPAAGPKGARIEDYLPPGMRIECAHAARDKWRLIIREDSNTIKIFEGSFGQLYKYAWSLVGKQIPAEGEAT